MKLTLSTISTTWPYIIYTSKHGYVELLCESIYCIESFDSRKVQMTHPNMDICTFSLCKAFEATLNTPGYRSLHFSIYYSDD